MLKSPQSNSQVKIEYSFNESFMLMAEIFKYNEESEQFESEKILYFDLSSLKSDTHYIGEYPVSSIITSDDEVEIDVINAVGDEWTDDEANPKWEEIEFEEFEIPEDAEIIQLEELVIPEPEPSPVDNLVRENAELKRSLDSLRSSMIQNNKNTEDLIVTLLAMM